MGGLLLLLLANTFLVPIRCNNFCNVSLALAGNFLRDVEYIYIYTAREREQCNIQVCQAGV